MAAGDPLNENTIRGLVVLFIIPNTDINVIDRGRREMFVEIAREESSFDPDVIGAAGEIGLWQIHPVHFPALEADGIVPDPEINLKNPVANAKAAAYVYSKQGFGAWTTASEATEAVAERGNADLEVNEDRATEWVTEQMGGDYDFGPLDLITDPLGTLGDLPGVGDWMDGLGKFLGIITSADFWKRIGLGVLGAGVIIAALIFWNKDEIQETIGAVK